MGELGVAQPASGDRVPIVTLHLEQLVGVREEHFSQLVYVVGRVLLSRLHRMFPLHLAYICPYLARANDFLGISFRACLKLS